MHHTSPIASALRRGLPICALVAFGGCATGTLPQSQLVETQAAIRGAQEVEASSAPKAALHLQYAEEQLASAQELAEDDPARASRLLQRAEADAELAIALAQEHTLREEAEETRHRIQEEREQHL